MASYDPVSEMFAQRVSDPGAWYRNARALFAAARASKERGSQSIDLRDRVDMDRVTSMLYGFGLECLLKALIVLADFCDPNDEGWCPKAEFPKKLATHNLLRLAEIVDPALPVTFEWELSISPTRRFGWAAIPAQRMEMKVHSSSILDASMPRKTSMHGTLFASQFPAEVVPADPSLFSFG